MEDVKNLFDLSGRLAVITGGTGLLGQQHAEAIAHAGGIPVLADIRVNGVDPLSQAWKDRFGDKALALQVDITDPDSVKKMLAHVLDKFGRIDILVNNAANNPKMEDRGEVEFSRLENFPLDQWDADLDVGLKGAFLCSQVIGSEMARRKRGVIVNVASDLAVIAPDQRLYRKPGLSENQQPVKPVTYSVVKTGLIGLTRYLATYWADVGVRVNAISPGGVYNGQGDDFVARLSNLIPLGRMANASEYQAAILFLCSDASSYMTGNNLVVDGGRSCW
jgi:NAD(P)-dependent dehydrogenase (short-subunit alcohol dehydrogenase family)